MGQGLMRDNRALPLVSVIIPTFNDGPLVCEAVECSLAQSYPSIEIIVVDDGSTDGTGELLHTRYGSRIRCIRQSNRGLAGARNTGIRHAAGKYFQFLDADDLLDTGKIEFQMEGLLAETGPALSYCDYRCHCIGDPDKFMGALSPRLGDDPFHDLLTRWETELSIPVHCYLFDASLFKGAGISFNERLANHEDWECWMNIFALQPKVLYIDRALVSYRVRGDSLCRDRRRMRQGYLEAIDLQLAKHRTSREISSLLRNRKRQVRYLYRDTGLAARVVGRLPAFLGNLYLELVPWRVQRLFD